MDLERSASTLIDSGAMTPQLARSLLVTIPTKNELTATFFLSSNESGEGDIRKNIIEADPVDGIVALPGQLFYTTQVPVCLWFLTSNKGKGAPVRPRLRRQSRRHVCSSN